MSLAKRACVIAIFCVLHGLAHGADAPPVRMALVIANGNYAGSAKLANAERDGQLMAQTLRSLGFSVLEQTNLPRKAMRGAISQFAAASADARVVLVYYAGHGVQVQGLNYLLPVNPGVSFPANERDVQAEGVGAAEVVAALGSKPGRINIVILDACRDNPFSGAYRSAGMLKAGGLAPMEAPVGTLIAYSTAPGKRSKDGGAGGNSVYTAALAEQLRRPGLDIENVFKNTRATVVHQTVGEQVPWESTSLMGAFSFRPSAFGQASAIAVHNPRATAGSGTSAQPRAMVGTADNRLAQLEAKAASTDLQTLTALRRQAAMGDNDAQVLAGLLLVDARQPAPARQEAQTWWEAAAARGDVAAQVLLGESLLAGPLNASAERSRGLDLLRAAALEGSQRGSQKLNQLSKRP